MRKLISTNLKSSVYNAIVNSQMSYAISVWGGTVTNDKLQPLFRLQKRALRNLYSIKRISKFIRGHTKDVFLRHIILTIYNVYNYMCIINMCKLIKCKEPIFCTKF